MSLFTSTSLHVCVLLARNHVQTHTKYQDRYTFENTFSQAKAPAVYFVTETENHNTNFMPQALVPTTCLIYDKSSNTQYPSFPFIPDFFLAFLAET